MALFGRFSENCESYFKPVIKLQVMVGKTSKKVPVTHGPSLLDFPSIYLYVFFAN